MNPGSGRPIYRAQAPRRRRESSVASSSSGSFHPSSFSNEHAACQDHIPDKGFDYQDAGHDKSHADEHEQAGDHRDLSLFTLIDSAKALRYTGTVQEVGDGTNELEPTVFFKYTRENHHLASQSQPHRRRTGTSA